jgi:hypothetical protein
MWHTSRGDRTLAGQEALLVSAAIEIMVAALLDHIDEDLEDIAPDCETGIAIYDNCTPAQRIGLLHDTARYLLTDTAEVLPLSALTDATVAAIFVEIRDQIAIEIGFAADGSRRPRQTWRHRVLAAHQSLFGDEGVGDEGVGDEGVGDEYGSPVEFGPDSEDLPEWEVLVTELADTILWDRDFEMADGFLDADPGVSHQRRRLLGIDDGYFTAVAPDPRPEEAIRLASRTRDIVRAKPR